MSFGGQGFPEQFNPGEDILKRQQFEQSRINENNFNREADYNRIMGQNPGPNFLEAAYTGAMNKAQQLPGQMIQGMQQSLQQSPEFQRMSADPEAYISAYMPQQAPQQQEPMRPPMDTSQIVPKAQEAGAAFAAVGNKIQNEKPSITRSNSTLKRSINDNLMSEVPEDFAEAISQFEKVRDEDIVEGTPQAMFKQKIDSQYLRSVDEKGNQTYECPLTKKPCGRKTFFQRLKEFFLHSIGKKSAEEVQKSVIKFDKIDPITKSADVQPTTEDPGKVWNSPYRLSKMNADTGMSGYKGAI